MFNRFLVLILAFNLCACQHSSLSTTENAAHTESSTTSMPLHPEQLTLAQLIEQAWQIELDESPQLDFYLGNSEAGARLPDVSKSTLQQRQQARLTLIKQLNVLPQTRLTTTEKINLQLLQAQLQNHLDLFKYKAHYMPISAESGFHADITAISKGPFNLELDYDNYLSQLSALPNYFAQQINWMKKGMAQGITLPQVVLKGFESSIEAFIVPTKDSIYFRPFLTFPAHFDLAKQQQLRHQGEQLINDSVLPLYQDFYRFMVEEYIPSARHSIAAGELPNGNAFYRNRVAYYTTLNMSADDVHQLGVLEVDRIKKEMVQIIDQVQFSGSFADFLNFLRTDPQFYPTSAEQLLKEAAYIAKKADAILPKYFTRLPTTPYGIEPVPAEIAPKYTTGRYSGSNRDDQPGYYWVNTYALNKRPLYELEALTLHEAVPGHHLQISLSKELTTLPNFRRYSYISAFGEGWGLYSEFLGLEAGFYQDPYSNFGRLTYEMWRAARLVIDTGIHAKGWSREQAINFMASNTALSLHNVTTEIDRYIAWPGQALSYKIGELTIKRLRKQAEQALGNKFDIRQFHDAILANGSVSLPILEQQIATFIQRQQAQ